MFLIIAITVAIILMLFVINWNNPSTIFPLRTTAMLSGKHMPIPNQSQAHGQFTGALVDENTLQYNLVVQGINSHPHAYIAHGDIGKVGPVVKILNLTPMKAGSATIYQSKGTWSSRDALPLQQSTIQQLLDGKLHVVVSNSLYEEGEIRGQIRLVNL